MRIKTIYIVITIVLLLFSYNGILNANPLPKCDSIKSQIIHLARRHAAADENMKSELIQKMFTNNSCYSDMQLIDIYENEYLLNKKSNFPWKAASFICLTIAFLAICFSEMTKKFAHNIFLYVSDSIYKRYCGSKLMRKVAIKKYRTSLFQKYKDVNIPFRLNKPLSMAEVFVPLKAIDISDKIQIDVLNAISIYDKLVIIGSPGSGKSMLCKNILFNYGNGNFIIEKIPILIELHRLNDTNITIEKILEDEMERNNFPKSKNFIEFNLRLGNFFLLFDGFDEINSKERKSVTQKIRDFIERYKKCNIIITCRQAVYKNIFSDIVKQSFELVEFNQLQIRMFLHSWGTNMPSGKSIDQLMFTLEERPNIMRMATNPLMLTIIAYLYTDTQYHVLPHSRGEFYQNATDVLLSTWHQDHNSYEKTDKALLLQNLAFSVQDESFKNKNDRKIISSGKIKEVFLKILPNLNLKDDDFNSVLKEIVERSGLLIKVDAEENYQFAHLTLQEYYAAQFLNENGNHLFEKFKQDCNLWSETLKLWCGLTKDATQMISDVYKINQITAFECLADTRSIDKEVAENIICHFQILLTNPETLNRLIIIKAFGSLASNIKKGQEIYNYLVNRFQETENEEELSIVAQTLSLTYLPSSAKIIASKYSNCDKIHEYLVHMGDLAITAFEIIAKTEFSKSLLGLHDIGTPNAALKLVNFIWESDVKATNSAWLLADMLKINVIEEALNKYYTIKQEHKVAHILDWIWKPFCRSVNSPLYFIVGRISFLLSNSLEKEMPYNNLKIDKRILIPLSIIQFNKISLNDYNEFKIINYLDIMYNTDYEVGNNDYFQYVKMKWNNNYYQNENIQEIKKQLLKKSRYVIIENENEFYKSEIGVKFLEYLKVKFDLNRDSKFISDNEVSKKQDELTNLVIDLNGRLGFKNIFKNYSIGYFISIINKYYKQNPTQNDWLNIKKPINFNMNKSINYYLISFSFTLFTLISLGYWGFLISNNKAIWNIWDVIKLTSGLIVTNSFLTHNFSKIEGLTSNTGKRDNYENLFSLGIFGFINIPYKLISNFDSNDLKNLSLIIWFPFICYYYTQLMGKYFNNWEIFCVGVGIMGFWIFLYVTGLVKERKSKNPLKGLLDIKVN